MMRSSSVGKVVKPSFTFSKAFLSVGCFWTPSLWFATLIMTFVIKQENLQTLAVNYKSSKFFVSVICNLFISATIYASYCLQHMN